MDNLSDPSTIDSLEYYVDFTGIYVIPFPSFSQRVENCAIEWSLANFSGETESVLTPI